MTEVTQADRQAAASLFRDGRTDLAVKFRLGANPEPLLEAFARHRIASDLAGYERGQRETVERIVAWLRSVSYGHEETAASNMAELLGLQFAIEAIEAGEWK